MTDNETKQKMAEMTRYVMPYTSPLFLLPNASASPDEVVKAGSCAFIDTGKKKLIVTCQHVWEPFMKHLKDNSKAVVAISLGNAHLCIQVQKFPLVDICEKVDLATLEVTDPSLLNGSEKTFAKFQNWPPRKPIIDDVILIVGWPTKNRILTDDKRDLRFRSTTCVETVCSVNDRGIMLVDSSNNRLICKYQEDILMEGSHGGMSGCPAFVNRDESFEYIGTTSQASDGSSASFFVTHASFINADGTIDRLAIPI